MPTFNDLSGDKLQLEIDELRSHSRLWWRIGAILLPALLPLAISGMSLYISWATQRQQAVLDRRNNELQERLRHREVVNEAVRLATEEASTRSVSGIFLLADFWKEPQDERIVASALSAVLVSPGGETNRWVRCRAADAIGMAYVGSEGFRDRPENDVNRLERIANSLYGNAETGEMGLIVSQNLSVKGRFDRSSSEVCENELDATLYAIRRNGEYLVNANLKDADLRKIALFRADLKGSSFARADVAGADFGCANLEGTDFTDTKWTQIFRIKHANVHGAKPEAFQKWAKSKGAQQTGDDRDWLDWRKGGFRLNGDKPVPSTGADPGRYCVAPNEE